MISTIPFVFKTSLEGKSNEEAINIEAGSRSEYCAHDQRFD